MHLGIIRLLTTEQHNPDVITMHFMDDPFFEPDFLTLLWQSGASESATVCFVISLGICYCLFKCGVFSTSAVLIAACVCVRERDRVTSQHVSCLNCGLCVCVCVCVWETVSHHSMSAILITACVCVCVCERERERDRVTSQHVSCLNRGLFANTHEHHHCVCHVTVPLLGLNWW